MTDKKAYEQIEELRHVLMLWVKYSQTLTEAGVTVNPESLMNKTVAILDATAC